MLTESLMLFHGALINDMNESFVNNFSEYSSATLLAVEENISGVVCAHDDHSEIRSIVMYVDVEQEFF